MGKYYDVSAVMQVIGGVYLDPSLIDCTDKYTFNEEDFCEEEFHRILFGTIYNLHQLGAKEITISTIENYLEQRPTKLGIYKANNGAEYLKKLANFTQPAAFDYYYKRVKKMTLLRMYQKTAGMDLKWLYDVDNLLDIKKKQAQEEWLDHHELDEIADSIDKKITDIRLKYVDNDENDFIQAGEGTLALLERLKEKPEIGYPLYGSLVNTIHRGARLKKFYLRSAATGMGKTRSMIADACSIACDKIYDIKEDAWVDNGSKEPTMFISTEQEEDEIQTMMLAFISGVNEEHILTGSYEPKEEERVIKASKILTKSPLYIKKLPDFSMQDIENTIKYGIREYDCRYIFHDYIHSSMKILSEVGGKSGVKGLREDNILFLISVKLKDLCNQYDVFIMTATQLNASYVTADVYDQNLLRGAKSIADKIDWGSIMLPVTDEDKEALLPVVQQMGIEMPVMKMSIYKNRRGRYKDILLWCNADYGTCRINPVFATSYQKELIEIKDLKIKITTKIQAPAF